MALSLSGSKAEWLGALALAFVLALLGACSSAPTERGMAPRNYLHLADPNQTSDIVVYALGLVDTGYRFGGSNPEAGLDCSGMVSHVVQNVAGLRLPHNAAQIAGVTRPIPRGALRPGDLVFFNTMKRPYSHMGLYIGDGRFVHAPSAKGRVRIERLDSAYFASRFDGARTLAN